MNARRLRVQGARRSHPPTHIEQRETTGPSIRHGHNAGGRQQTDAPELSNVIHVGGALPITSPSRTLRVSRPAPRLVESGRPTARRVDPGAIAECGPLQPRLQPPRST